MAARQPPSGANARMWPWLPACPPGSPSSAWQVAQELHHSGRSAGQRSQQLQASLLEQLQEARVLASQAAAARAAAEAAAAAAQLELDAAKQQQAALAKAASQAKGAGPAAQQRVQRILADARAGRAGLREAEQRLRELEREAAPPDSAAAVRLFGLRAAAQVRVWAAAAPGSPRWTGPAQRSAGTN